MKQSITSAQFNELETKQQHILKKWFNEQFPESKPIDSFTYPLLSIGQMMQFIEESTEREVEINGWMDSCVEKVNDYVVIDFRNRKRPAHIVAVRLECFDAEEGISMGYRSHIDGSSYFPDDFRDYKEFDRYTTWGEASTFDGGICDALWDACKLILNKDKQG